jgi:hypothetical protein
VIDVKPKTNRWFQKIDPQKTAFQAVEPAIKQLGIMRAELNILIAFRMPVGWR